MSRDPYPPPPWAKVEIAGQIVPADAVLPPRPATDYARAFAEYNPADFEDEQRPSPLFEALLHATVNAEDWHQLTAPRVVPSFGYTPATKETTVSFDAEATCPGEEPTPVRAVVTWTPPRRIFAAVALDGSGVWAIGDTEQEVRASAVDRREHLRDPIVVDCDFPPPETDAAWLDTLTIVTLSGTTEGLRALIRSMETGDPVAPWCPSDLWDSGEVTP